MHRPPRGSAPRTERTYRTSPHGRRPARPIRHVGLAAQTQADAAVGARTVVLVARVQRLVQLFGSRKTELGALRALMGGVTMTHLRSLRPTRRVFEALVEGLRDPNPRVRWWCVQILDHSPDPQAIAAIAPMLDDPVPRVRQNAAHALGCLACKPAWSGALPMSVLDKLNRLADGDAHSKVRRQARWALGCHTQPATANNR